ncbi:hypothetical protein N7520_001860 [Penicillium odoratum]|uniref:uncharacterized protein n=1 Tax=Penicillium odoratum TaxID=1167516 RepID=UPI002547A625|nr:uncharacterized protein N7520_001860 [Penicillium odoratum]KAJ5778614.1 hypothetical protein N7520_001860 [Penicillium odoratum]
MEPNHPDEPEVHASQQPESSVSPADSFLTRLLMEIDASSPVASHVPVQPLEQVDQSSTTSVTCANVPGTPVGAMHEDNLGSQLFEQVNQSSMVSVTCQNVPGTHSPISRTFTSHSFEAMHEDSLAHQIQPRIWTSFAPGMRQALAPSVHTSDVNPLAPIDYFSHPTTFVELAVRRDLSSDIQGLRSSQMYSDEPFLEAPNPVVKAEPGNAPSSMFGLFDHVKSTAKPTTLGLTDVDNLSDNEILFLFGAFSQMFKLSPRFEFKHGGKRGKKIGLKLTVFGHTVLLPPTSEVADEIRILGCKKILAKLRGYNPQWEVPPQPISGLPSSLGWNWPNMLEDFCANEGWSFPIYKPTMYGNDNQWHCDVSMNGHLFRTSCPSDGKEQARTTAAHLALYTLLVNWRTTPEYILPVNDPAFTFAKAKWCKAKKNTTVSTIPAKVSTVPVKASSSVDSLMSDLEEAFIARNERTQGVRSSKGIKMRGKMIKEGPKPAAAIPPKAPKAMARKAKAAKARAAKVSALEDANSNSVPLANCRVAPRMVKPEVVEIPLKLLKDMEHEVATLSGSSSYATVLSHMCLPLGVNPPDIRFEPDPESLVPRKYILRAWFDLSHPYLYRASPIMLARIGKTDEKEARLIGVKQAILYLLDMVQEDSGINILDPVYEVSFPTLKALEIEVKNSFARRAPPYAGL